MNVEEESSIRRMILSIEKEEGTAGSQRKSDHYLLRKTFICAVL